MDGIAASGVPLPTPLPEHSSATVKVDPMQLAPSPAPSAAPVATSNDETIKTQRPHVGPPTPPDSNEARSPRPPTSHASPSADKAANEHSKSGAASSVVVGDASSGQDAGVDVTAAATAQMEDVEPKKEEEDSGPDYYTSASDSDTEDDDETIEAKLSQKQREKRQRLRAERDRLKPKYYYGEKEAHEEARSQGRRVGKAKKGMRGVPVFEPTMDQFRDFYSYIQAIDHWGMRSGIVKVVPPKEWTESLPHLGTESLREDGQGQMLKEARIKSPIAQHVQGSQGLYRVLNVTKGKAFNPLQWYDYVNSRGLAPPDFFGKCAQQDDDFTGSGSAGPSTPNAATGSGGATESTGRETRATRSARVGVIKQLEKKKPPKPKVSKAKARASMSVAPSEVGTPMPEEDQKVEMEDLPLEDPTGSAPAPVRPPTDVEVGTGEGLANVDASQPPETPQKREAVPSPGEVLPAPFDTPATTAVDPNSSETPAADGVGTPAATTTVGGDSARRPRARKVPVLTNVPDDDEWAEFVKVYDQLPYDAKREDYTVEACKEIEAQYWRSVAVGTEPVYGADTKGSLFDERTTEWNVAKLDNLLTRLKLKQKIPGVNTPYLYFGAWRATFAWHVEDVDLYSINYIHFGAPKHWYAIAQEQNPRFERYMASQFGPEAKKCSQFLRHKSFLASPHHLANAGLSLNKVVQLPGEIILTYPFGYHSGFNLGFNCAESVNFATEAWIEIGRKAKSCACANDSVSINVDAWLAEHAEAEAREQERLAKIEAKKEARSKPKLPKPPKRKRESEASQQVSGGTVEIIDDDGNVVVVPAPAPSAKKKKADAPAKKEFPCALCPDPSEETLVRIEEVVPGKKPKMAHKICCMFTPATWLEMRDDGEEVVKGFEDIEKARWALKCQLCNEKMGTKVQCTKSAKCVRACHVTCGMHRDSGFLVDAQLGSGGQIFSLLDPNSDGQVPPGIDPNSAVNLVVLCRQHNPAWVAAEKERKVVELSDRICALPIGSTINVRMSAGVFGVRIVAHNPQRLTVAVQFPNGHYLDLPHSKVVFESAAALRAAQAAKDREDPYIYEHPRTGGSLARNRSSTGAPSDGPAPSPFPTAGPSTAVPQPYPAVQPHQTAYGVAAQHQQPMPVYPQHQQPMPTHGQHSPVSYREQAVYPPAYPSPQLAVGPGGAATLVVPGYPATVSHHASSAYPGTLAPHSHATAPPQVSPPTSHRPYAQAAYAGPGLHQASRPGAA